MYASKVFIGDVFKQHLCKMVGSALPLFAFASDVAAGFEH